MTQSHARLRRYGQMNEQHTVADAASVGLLLVSSNLQFRHQTPTLAASPTNLRSNLNARLDDQAWWAGGLATFAFAVILVFGSDLSSRTHADPGVAAPPRNKAEVIPERVGPQKHELATQLRANRDVPKQRLRYTVEVLPDPNRRGVLAALALLGTDLELNGSLWMTAKLHNDGDQPVRVYWGDYALPKMYHFEVKHESGWMPAVVRQWPDDLLPKTGDDRYFVVVPPGGFVAYNLLLTTDYGANCERCYLNRPGRYTIFPTLNVAARQSVNRETSEIREVPGVWTGQLKAEPFSITVKGDRKLLDDGVRIHGQVVDAAGKGVSKAIVIVRHRVRDGHGSSYMSVNGESRQVELAQDCTDAEGRFEFFRLPAESPSFELDVQHVEHPPRREVVFNRAPIGSKQRSYEAKVTLDAGRTVRGRVRDSQGRPLPDTRITLRGVRETYTDEDGRFKLTGLPPKVPDAQICRFGFIDRPYRVPTADEDASRYWIVTLPRDAEQTVSGTAVFADGEPLSNMELSFTVRALEKGGDSGQMRDRVLATKTDGRGRFTLVLSELVEYEVQSVTANVAGEFYLPRRTWRTKSARIKPKQTDINLVFDNTQHLSAELRPVHPLPNGFELKVRCDYVDARQIIEEIRLPHTGGTAEFKKLSPGKYSVTVEILPDRAFQSVSKTINIPARGDGENGNIKNPDSRLLFNFPDLRFGRLTGKVVTAEGKPALIPRINYIGQGTSGYCNLDAHGQFELKHIPVGKVTINAELPGFAGSAEVEIHEGKTKAVQIVLKPFKSIVDTGTVVGRILYEDGSVALGADVEEHNAKPLGADGSYSVVVRKDRPMFRINLTNADGWPRFDRTERLKSIWEKGFVRGSLQVTLPVQTGQTIARDIVLDRTKFGSLTLNWNRPPEQVMLFVSVVPFKAALPAKGPRIGTAFIKDSVAFDEQLLFTRMMSVSLEQNKKLVVPDVPWGRRTVLLGSHDHYRTRLRTLAPDQTDAVLIYDSKDDGHIRFRLLDGAVPVKGDLGFELTMSVRDRPKQSIAVSRFPDSNAGESPKNPYRQTDGWFQISQLDAGQYELTIRDGSRSKTLAVAVKPRETTAVEVRLNDSP